MAQKRAWPRSRDLLLHAKYLKRMMTDAAIIGQIPSSPERYLTVNACIIL